MVNILTVLLNRLQLPALTDVLFSKEGLLKYSAHSHRNSKWLYAFHRRKVLEKLHE